MKTIFAIITLIICNSSLLYAQKYRTAEEAKGLSVGIKSPDFSAVDQHGKMFRLYDQLKIGPVVIVFYRGFWCPVCNKHLGKLQDSLALIEAAGARVIAISPEKPEYLEKTAKKTGAQFTLLYDDGYRISDSYDVTFRPGKSTLVLYDVFTDADLKKAHSDDSQRLPIPATYIIGKNGTIIWRQFDPDYKKRSAVKEILQAIK
ncbi:MAG: peroxiredoxin-like family protein [Bacteroidales bacterium]|nr:peroxiredoxin-like family protein [Bacteroidales bacterium]